MRFAHRRVFSVLLLPVLACAPAHRSTSDSPAPRTRVYYIAADEVPWDYDPGGRDDMPAGRTPTRLSSMAPSRSRSVRYTGRFSTVPTPTAPSAGSRLGPAEWAHLGFLGPVIHAVVGDTIRVVFRNNGHRPFSMHPHGVFYQKSSEGAPYNDGAGDGRTGNGVPPGGTFVYVWPVPERAGPGPMDGSSVLWMYHSHVDEVRDINTGTHRPDHRHRARQGPAGWIAK